MTDHDETDAKVPDEVLPAPRAHDETGHEPDDEPEGEPGGASGADLGALLGGLDLGSLLGMAGEMQRHLTEAQAEADATVLEGVAGGGVVKIAVSGSGEFRSVTIDPQVVDPDDVEMLQDLVLAALHDAMDQLGHVRGDAVSGAAGVSGLLGGLPDLGGLGDLFGGAG